MEDILESELKKLVEFLQTFLKGILEKCSEYSQWKLLVQRWKFSREFILGSFFWQIMHVSSSIELLLIVEISISYVKKISVWEFPKE